ncbi:MAG TPA: hypothetical protein VN842_05870 [Thermoplasmata archaeon]|nr:hypothetical protein [Thermoplasmata archaeon]
MPGAPNRPPPKDPEVAVAPSLPETPERQTLRRLGPSRVALRLDQWKGAPSPDLLTPFHTAESAYVAGDYTASLKALDQLSVRFAEPRWPTLPEPFRRLRVPIPPPMPPHWDPEHGMAVPEKEARRARRSADDQLALARASVAWATVNGTDLSSFAPRVEEAAAILEAEGVVSGFYERIDAVWLAVREHVVAPASRPAARAAPAPEAVGEA